MMRSTGLALALSVLAIGLVIALGVRLNRATQEEIVSRFKQRQLLLVERMAAGIQSVFDEAQRDLLHLEEGGGPACLSDALGAQDEERIAICRGITEQGFSSYLRSHPGYVQMRYIDAGGQEIVGVDSGGGVVRFVPWDQLQSRAEHDYFVAAMQLGVNGIYASPPLPSPSEEMTGGEGYGGAGAGRWLVRLATPVFDSQGRRQGIVVLDLLGDGVRAQAAWLSAESGMDVWVLDETGVEIVNVGHPEREGSNVYEYCRQAGDEALAAVAEDMLAGGRGVGVYSWPEGVGDPRAAERLTAYAPIRLAADRVWSAGVSVPYDTVLVEHRRTHRVLVSLAGSIVVVILAWAVLAIRSDHKRALAEEQARLSETLYRRVEELSFLSEISRALSGSLDQHELLTTLLHQTTATLKAEAGSICLREEDGSLRFVLAVGPQAEHVQGLRIPPGQGIAGWCIREEQSVLVPDVENDPRWHSGVDDDTGFVTRSILCLPLRVRSETIGVLEMLNKAGGFNQDDLRLMESVTAQAAVAIENARLYQAELSARENADTLREVSRAVSSTLELDDLLPVVLHQAKRVLTYDTASIMLFSDGKPAVVAVAGYEDEELVKAEVSLRLGDSPILRAMSRDRRPVLIADVREDERWIWVPGAEDVRAWIGVPLLVRDEMIGALMIDSTQPGFYTDAHVAIAQALASQVAVAIENARLYDEARRRTEELVVLNELAQLLTARLSVEAVLNEAYRGASRLLDANNFYVALYDPDRDEVTFAMDVTEGEVHKSHTVRASGQGLTEYIIRNRTPVLIRENVPERLEKLGVELIGPVSLSWLGVPLLVGERVVGMMAVQSYTTPCAYDEHDRDLLTTIASETAVALENARLYEQAQQRLESLTSLNRASQIVTSYLDAQEVLEQIVSLAGSVVNSDHTSVVLLDEEGKPVLGAGDFLGAPSITHPITQRIRSRGVTRHVLDSGCPLVVDDISADGTMSPPLRRPDGELIEANPDIVAAGIRSFAAAPIQIQESRLGVLFVHSHRPRAFRGQLPLLITFANQAAIAIENARLYEQARREIAERERAEEALKRRVTQLATVSEVGRQITSLLELDPLLEHIVNLIREAFGYHYVSIFLIDRDAGELVLRAGAGYDPEIARSLHLRVGKDGICGWVAASGEPLLAADVSQEPRYCGVGGLSTRSELTVPIQLSDHVVGVLDVQSAVLDDFDEDDLSIMQTLADQVAVALENAGLYQELRDYAARLEQRVQERTAQLQAQYARLDAILRSGSDGIVVTDRRGEIVQSNPVAQAWLTQTLSPEDAARLQGAIQDLARRAEQRPETVLELTGLDLELSVAPISEPVMEDAAAVVAIHDVSHLRALNRMKSRFVTNVSHELRTPVTTIKLYAALMKQTPPEDEKWGKYLDALAQEADRQARLVQDILQISRIDAGRMEMQPRPTPLDEVIEATIASHQVLARDEGVTLEHHSSSASGGPVALVDPDRMIQVVSNLLGNAILYTPQGGKIVLSAGTEEVGGRVWATMRVTDTGMGIPADELPHIFERFFRGAKPRSMQISGTGLGLAIVKEIVELHGGWVTVESEVGVGAAFTVWLPLAA